jgi:hypothetical protein
MPDAERTIRALVQAFAARDEQGMRATLAEGMTAFVTNAAGGVDAVSGRDRYLGRLLALQAPRLDVTIPQSVAVPPDQALAMVEIRAERQGKSLHNFAAFLARVEGTEIVELWMVEALPAYSAEFWQ